MRAWIWPDITGGRTDNNIGVALIQFSYCFLQSRPVRAVG